MAKSLTGGEREGGDRSHQGADRVELGLRSGGLGEEHIGNQRQQRLVRVIATSWLRSALAGRETLLPPAGPR